MQYRVRGCLLQRSLDNWPTLASLQSMCTPHKCTSHSPTTKHHLRTPCNVLRHVAAAKLTRSKYSWPFCHRPKIHQPVIPDMLSATCGRTPVLLTEHVDTKVSRSRSTNQGFVRNLRSNHLCPVPAISSLLSTWLPRYSLSVPSRRKQFDSALAW